MKRLLLVDDEPAVLRGVGGLLSAYFEIDIAHDAEAACALLQKESYDAVLTDFQLPGQSGLSVLQLAKERCPSARRILTSADPASIFQGQPLVDRFVRKPATLEQLLSALQG